MLFELGLRNFKAFGDKLQTANFSKLNFIYGPNSGGKSSLIQALLLLKQSRRDQFETDYLTREPAGKLRPRGDFVDLGSFPALLHKHDLARMLEISLSYRGYGFTDAGIVTGGPIQASMTFSPNRLHAPTDIAGMKYRILQNDTTLLDGGWYSGNAESVSVDAASLSMIGIEIPTNMVAISHVCFLPYPYVPGFVPEAGVDWAKASSRKEIVDLVLKLEQISEPGQLQTLMALSSRHSYEMLFKSITYLGSLRSYPERVYAVSGRSRRSIGVRGEFMPDFLSATPSTIFKVNQWFERFELPYDVSVDTLGELDLAGEYIALALLDKQSHTRMTLADVGFGINQLLPVMVEGLAETAPDPEFYFNPYGSILCIEQPEIHLHPRLQAEVADLMIETSLGNKGKQWIVETHSELLIRRIQRRIAEGILDPSDVSVIYVDPQVDTGSTIELLRLDEDGEFVDNWPKGFFEEGYNEMMAY